VTPRGNLLGEVRWHPRSVVLWYHLARERGYRQSRPRRIWSKWDRKRRPQHKRWYDEGSGGRIPSPDILRYLNYPPVYWLPVGFHQLIGEPIKYAGFYVFPYCDSYCCRPDGPFPSKMRAFRWSRARVWRHSQRAFWLPVRHRTVQGGAPQASDMT